MIRKILAGALLAMSLSAGGCDLSSKGIDPHALQRQVSENTFRSEMFGITAIRPEGWYAMTLEDLGMVSKAGADAISNGNSLRKLSMKLAESRTFQLMGFTAVSPSEALGVQPSLMVVVERVPRVTGVITAEQYLQAAGKMLKSASINYQIDPQLGKRTIDGQEFSVLTLAIPVEDGMAMAQKFMAALHNGYAYCFIVTSISEEDAAILSAALDEVRLDW